MEIGEVIAVAIAGTDEGWECPFSHEPEPGDHENVFVGTGTKLGKNMEAGKSTSNNKEYGGGDKVKADSNPGTRRGHTLNKAENPRPLTLMGSEGTESRYPLTCAAHHLIPAQASLAKSELLPWLIKKGETGTIKSGKSTQKVPGEVDNHVGYDVNGAENGVWLPGPYAMKRIWAAFAGGDDEEEEEPDTPEATEPEGPVGASPETQFDYAVAAMILADGQFHDSHPEYSKKVKDMLDKIAARLDAIAIPESCEKCAERIAEGGVPAPYTLITRLNGVSSRLRSFLEHTPEFWSEVLYTSKKALEYMNEPDHVPGHFERH